MTWLLLGKAFRWLAFDKFGHWVGIALLASLVVGGIYLKGRSAGKTAGKEEQRTEQVQGIKEGLDQDRTATQQKDAAIRERIIYHSNEQQLAAARAEGYRKAELELKDKQAAAPQDQKLAICEDRVETLYQAAAEDRKQTQELVAKTVALAEQVSNQAAYTNRLENRFVELWNSNPPKTRQWSCPKTWIFGIGKCKDKLKPPPLAEIQASR